MKPAILKQFAKRKKRAVLSAFIAVLLASACTLKFAYHRSVFSGGLRIYSGHVSIDTAQASQSVEQRLWEHWEGQRTGEVQGLVRDFDRSIAQRDRVHAVHIGGRLACLLPPSRRKARNQGGIWLFRTVTGDIYLEQIWLDEAEHEFQSVLSAVPPGEPGWGKSLARKQAAYGLARTSALRGSYEEALKWLASAPGEYNGGCGNENEAEAVRNYPLEVVWKTANKPLSIAVTPLQDVMAGRFTPRESWLCGDTSEEQKQHAAAEAGFTLGCLYNKAGRHADAEACWDQVASNADSQYEVTTLARAMLSQLRND